MLSRMTPPGLIVPPLALVDAFQGSFDPIVITLKLVWNPSSSIRPHTIAPLPPSIQSRTYRTSLIHVHAPKDIHVMTGATTAYETNDIHLDGVAAAVWNDERTGHVLGHNPRGLNSSRITHNVMQFMDSRVWLPCMRS
ncbi:hypothetical protein QCA50_010196 [Cerrena zonata]|uniref:Uncharacterized protein n=1 Tax=Cerrena zonata TaxID=2478898 RepID=A0AAW0GAF7_9APHY